ncbi:flagellar basal body-associated FliL family protein [Marivivens sp. LCG002]|uniref:flagellar basal body-associated FliL family protein n=1 Tax=Marivivens sp. LCG002 TaxID=3051171 RepID=UPI00255722CC|nr:flagellar basal body-associated FliL family protein [Marivivens sp. LCG002]WIV51286.1 flagellar basal body-associated FliL family protein [Marivivens sp. LCG002]
MSDVNTDAPKKPGILSKIIKLVVRLVVAAVLVGAGFGGGYFYFANPLSPSQSMLTLLAEEQAAKEAEGEATEGEVGPKKIPKTLPETELFQTSYYEMEDALTTNLKDSRRFLQIGVSMSTQYDQAVIDNVQTHKLAIRSDILGVIGSFTEADIEGAVGRENLALAIRDVINKRLEQLEGFGGIEDVFFSTFVLQ